MNAVCQDDRDVVGGVKLEVCRVEMASIVMKSVGVGVILELCDFLCKLVRQSNPFQVAAMQIVITRSCF